MGSIILAGGKSSRMGQDKALLPYQNTTLLLHMVSIVQMVSEPVVVVAERADEYELPADIQQAGDLFPGQGPLGGVITGLHSLPEGYHLVVGCDMPQLQGELVRLMFQKAEGFDGAVPEVGGQLEPLCAVYHSRCAGTLELLLQSGMRALHKAISYLNMYHIKEESLRRADPQLLSFLNLNTPEEYREWGKGL